MAVKKKRKAVTLVEMIVAVLIMAFLAGYAWKLYSNSGESMRHTVSQSQIQSDIRIFLDNLETEMMTCYIFDTIDTEKKKFSFYCFTYSKVSLDDIFYDGKIPRSIDEDSDASIKVKKMEYSWSENGIVTKKRTPGFLYFLKRPMIFQPSNSNAFDETDKAMTKEVLKDITEFEVKGYAQELDSTSDDGFKITPVEPKSSTRASFIVLRLHAYKEEGKKRRDEEIDIVTKFYSAVRLANTANPEYFCSTDNNGSF